MIRRLVLALGLVACAGTAMASGTCTIIADTQTGRLLQQSGACEIRVSPASTFKIALGIMGYDAGVLRDAHDPAWPYRKEFAAARESWRKTTDPTTWMTDSVVWYSQELTRALGEERFGSYVDRFGYGNRNVTGDPGRGNGLTRSWLSSSLKISPLEQIVFLRKVLRHELPVPAQAMEATLALVPRFSAKDGWTVRGKTGSGFRVHPSGKRDRERQFGWFVGWAEKDGSSYLFARLLTDLPNDGRPPGFQARDSLLDDLPKLMSGY